jgi:hypothetical protein
MEMVFYPGECDATLVTLYTDEYGLLTLEYFCCNMVSVPGKRYHIAFCYLIHGHNT